VPSARFAPVAFTGVQWRFHLGVWGAETGLDLWSVVDV
jgi:hypothetical protein